MEKFSRVYSIVFTFKTFENGKLSETIKEVRVDYPLTVEFAIGRSISYFTNSANVVIYGLDENKRKELGKDRYNLRKYIRMEIYAGYEKNPWLIYRGSVTECYSYRQGGETEFRTIITSSDASIEMLADINSRSFSESVDMATRINNISTNLIELKLGVISPYIIFPKKTDRGSVITGTALDMLSQIADIDGEEGTENVMNIDMGEVNFLLPYKDIIKKYGILKVDDSTGLLSTPIRRESILSIQTLFEPAANLNQLCYLDVKSMGIKGYFKIMSVSHDGVISGAKCGALTTTLDLYLGFQAFNEI